MSEQKQHFASDNTAAVIPEAWQTLEQANNGFVAAYGEDEWTSRAQGLINDLFETSCDVFFVLSGTAANALSLASMCQPHHKVICHEHAHLVTAECGAPGFFTQGAGLEKITGEFGKLDLDNLQQVTKQPRQIYYQSARAVSITQPTEYGVPYTIDELHAVAAMTKEYDWLLHMDGARFLQAVTALNTTPAEMSWKVGVDVLSFGATKLGLPAGEAVVFFNQTLAKEFGHRCKQTGHVASKGRYLSAPWIGLLQDNAWEKHARHANTCAQELARQLEEIEGVNILVPVQCNFVLVDMPAKVHQAMHDKDWFYHIVMGETGARLLCSWDTRQEDIDSFIADLKEVV